MKSETNTQVLINPPGTENIYKHMRFSQAVRVGNTVRISGQVGMDADGQVSDSIEEQSRAAFRHLESVIAAAGGTLADIVELVTYHTSMKEIGAFSKVKSEFIRENYPAWTAVGVTELVMPQLKVEIRAVVEIGSGQGKELKK